VNKTIYIVGQKASFVHAGRMYKPGDEISSELFDKTALDAAIKSGKLLTEAQAKAQADQEEQSTPPAAASQKSLDDMDIDELKAYAASKNISVKGNKAEMLSAIKAAEAGGGNQ
jgi:hypothetical protein